MDEETNESSGSGTSLIWGPAEKAVTVQPGEGSGRSHSCIQILEGYSDRQWAQYETQEVPSVRVTEHWHRFPSEVVDI